MDFVIFTNCNSFNSPGGVAKYPVFMMSADECDVSVVVIRTVCCCDIFPLFLFFNKTHKNQIRLRNLYGKYGQTETHTLALSVSVSLFLDQVELLVVDTATVTEKYNITCVRTLEWILNARKNLFILLKIEINI